MTCRQIETAFHQIEEYFRIASYIREWKGQNILITTYQDAIKNQLDVSIYDLIVCNEGQFLTSESATTLFSNEDFKCLGVLENTEGSDRWFYDAECLYSYTIKDATRDGYDILQFCEQSFVERFLVKLLEYQGYKNITQDEVIGKKTDNNIRVDIVAEIDNISVIIEVKTYRNLYNSKLVVNNAVRRLLQYQKMLLKNSKSKEYKYIIVMPCEVEDDIQKEILEQFNIIIWDINNLVYLCEDNKELFQSLMSCMPFSVLEIKGKKPLKIQNVQDTVILDEPTSSLTELYQMKLESCKAGKLENSDKQYEAICTEIIKYLFQTEFYKISEQHKTEDEMFRMDLLCSLKGTTEFWKFLIQFYHTKFVVFEYKNYSNYISQNLIYVTEKYLFPVALRNVAFIVSRKGFDPNAQNAAIGCLRENGKLIISLDDNDLISMISMKENGEEPSDFLLDKVEQILMSVSK